MKYFSLMLTKPQYVKTSNGTSSLMANLTNLAAWRADGTIPSDQELKTDWLRLP
jgi:hypothetical protein